MVSEAPVFYDASGRRRRRFRLALAAFVLLAMLATIGFGATILAVVPQSQLPFPVERSSPAGLQEGFAKRSDRSLHRILHYAKRLWKGADAQGNAPLAIAFHTPWDDASAASLQRHIEELDWLVPGWLSITGPDHHVTLFPDARGKAIIAHAVHRPKVLPMIQNAIDGQWDGLGMAALLHDPAARKATLDRIEALLIANRADGAFFDLEDLPVAAHPDYRRFLAEAHVRFAAHKWIIAIAVPADNPEWNLAAYARVADKLVLMAYDEHYQGGDPGPIASQRWFEQVVAKAARVIPPDRMIVAIGSYAYDWKKGGDTDALSVEEAWLNAKESGVLPRFDPDSRNSRFLYDEAGVRHDVWIADAASANNQMAALGRMGVRSIALWRLGSEDPSLWALFGRDNRTMPNPGVIRAIPAGTNVDIEGQWRDIADRCRASVGRTPHHARSPRRDRRRELCAPAPRPIRCSAPATAPARWR